MPNDQRESHRVLIDEPAMGRLAVRAAGASLIRRSRPDSLPDTVVSRRTVVFDRDHLARYADVCGFRLGNTLPGTYLHLLGFPLSLELMARRDFPFPALGLVHVTNRIIHHRPVTIDETVDVSVSAENLRPHPSGRQLDLHSRVVASDQTVWEGVSTYLQRGSGDEDADSTGPSIDIGELPLTAVWRVGADTGRRYAAISGDRNPIHLTALTAKAFGFPRAIAHGMWTAARSLAAFEGSLPDAWTYDVAFKRPLFLPSTVEYATRTTPDGWELGVRARNGAPHLVATLAE